MTKKEKIFSQERTYLFSNYLLCEQTSKPTRSKAIRKGLRGPFLDEEAKACRRHAKIPATKPAADMRKYRPLFVVQKESADFTR
jgi:hypothetical protein